MTKDEVFKINPKDYKIEPGKYEDGLCPETSNGNFWYLDRCSFEYYCKDDKTCSSVVRTEYNTTVELPDANGVMTRYNAEICENENGYCDDSTKCKADSDCLSNKCQNNYCVRNDDVYIEKCQDTYHYHTLIFSSSIDMKCGKPDGYTCKKNKECASDICDNGICQFQGRRHYFDFLSSILLYCFI